MINPILHYTMVSNNMNNPMRMKGSHRSSLIRNHKLTHKTALASDPILDVILQLMDQMMRMNSRMDEIQDFIKTNVQLTTDKKGKQVTFTD